MQFVISQGKFTLSFSYLTVKMVRLVKNYLKGGKVMVPCKTRNVALQGNIEEQTEMNKPKLLGQTLIIILS